MKFLLSGILCVLLYTVSLSHVSARIIIPPAPEVLAEQSTLVCNGRVESVSVTGDGFSAIITAKIKVLHVFKGEPLSELEIRYDNSQEFAQNGGFPISLNQNSRYRFFLKKGSVAPFYVLTYDGLDKCYSVEALASNEADDAAFINKKELTEIAAKWMKDHHPELPPLIEYPASQPPGSPSVKLTLPRQMIIQEWYERGRYSLVVQSRFKDGSGNNRVLVILTDRTVDEKAWDKSN
jgi:hypothetical protein